MQAASAPQLNAVFGELFASAGGAEVYLRAATGYGLPVGVPVSWAQICEVVRAKGDTAIGIGPSAPGSSIHRDMQLAVPTDHEVLLQARDRLVVVSQRL